MRPETKADLIDYLWSLVPILVFVWLFRREIADDWRRFHSADRHRRP